MNHSDYLKHPAYGASDIIKMGHSFAHWKYLKENPEPKGRALVVGSATHLMLQAELTSDKALLGDIGLWVDGSSLTKGFKAYQAENPQLYCLDSDEMALCKRMVKALLDDREVSGYLEGAVAEETIMAKYPNSDVLCKVRPDYLHKGRGISINIKTTVDSSESGFLYGARDFGYDWQSALYCTVLTQHFARSFDEIHILVEKTGGEPCPVEIYTFDDDTLAFARSQIAEVIAKIPECERTGVWPKNPAFLKQIGLPLHMRRAVSI